MSLKLRLNILITTLLGLLLLVGTVLLIHNARRQVQAEVESIAALATHLLDKGAISVTGHADVQTLRHTLLGLEHLRHLRIEFRDRSGHLLDSSQGLPDAQNEAQPPSWFVRLVTVALPAPVEIRRPLAVNGKQVGEVTVIPDPSYEVAEIWKDTVGLFTLVTIFFVMVNLMVYWAVDRALSPVDTILTALTELERGNLAARLPPFELPELARISKKFNGMAQTLQHSIERNHKLSQQLIRLQEEERKSLARDLHDELGQYLTAIRTDGAALLEMSKTAFPAARESAQAIVDVTMQVMAVINAMLQRLRPDMLDELGLQSALIELVNAWRQRNHQIICILRIPQKLPALGDAVNITAYRIVQECLTNVARHARAKRVEIELKILAGAGGLGPALSIRVADDGIGMAADGEEGLGISGMRERVIGLGGRLDIHSRPGMGTRVHAILPIGQQESS